MHTEEYAEGDVAKVESSEEEMVDEKEDIAVEADLSDDQESEKKIEKVHARDLPHKIDN